MNSRLALFLWFLAIFITLKSHSQDFNSGFSKEEYLQMMLISARTSANAAYYSDLPEPESFKCDYKSPVTGMDNRWDLWTDSASNAVISIRGTTASKQSWMANVYAAMVPAKGEIIYDTNKVFQYQLANNPDASVHVGWLLSLAYLNSGILHKLDSCYQVGVKNVYLTGHSQGGAITYLLTAHLRQLQRQKKLPEDMHFKTYCSAAPKPGNLYFAYEYENLVGEGWAYNVVNAADWVPQTPISIQTLDDFNPTNPFLNAKKRIRKLKFPRDIIFRKVFNKLNKPTQKAQKNYQKYLGNKAGKLVMEDLPGFEAPIYSNSNDYVRTGQTIVMIPDEQYYKVYPESEEKVFIHHVHRPYLFLLERLNP
jgi:hypothetical protein